MMDNSFDGDSYAVQNMGIITLWQVYNNRGSNFGKNPGLNKYKINVLRVMGGFAESDTFLLSTVLMTETI